MDLSTIISVLSIFSIIIGFIIQHFMVISKLQERVKEVEVKSDLFWKVVETEIPKILHSPHSIELDSLLEKMEQNKLDAYGAKELMKMLRQERDESNPDFGKKIAIVLLMARLGQKFGEKIE